MIRQPGEPNRLSEAELAPMPIKVTPSLIYVPVLLLCITVVFVSTYSYSWSSALIDLNCSIQDDSFYYFIPAWNESHGAGFTFGGEKTSGFQPLYELLLTTISYFCSSLESLVRTAINLNGCLFALTALLCGFALKPIINSVAPGLRPGAVALSMAVAALSYLCLHTVFFNSLTGKENALAALLLSALVWKVSADGRTTSHAILVGILCGLLLVTRISPASILYAGIGIAFVRGVRGKVFAGGMLLLPVAAWALFAHAYFGHVLPMSMLVKMSAPNHLTVVQSIKAGLKYGWESWKFSTSAGSHFNVLQLPFRNGTRTGLQVAVMGSALGLAMLGLFRSLLTRRPPRALLVLVAFDLGGALSNVLFGAVQAGRFDDMYYAVWYLYDLPVLVAINCGFAAAWLQSELAGMRHGQRTTALLLIGCAAYYFSDIVWYARLKPYSALDDEKIAASWAIRKYEVAHWFQSNVKPTRPDYKVVAFSAGTIGFYLFDHVVNLDGLANNAAGEAMMKSGSTVEYAKGLRPDYILDDCGAEKLFSNLERLYSVPFSIRSSYCIYRFVYD